MRYRHNRRNTQQMLEGNHHGFAFNLRKRKLLRQQKTKNEQDNPCSYIQEDAKCRQKEIECPFPTLRLVMNTRYVLGRHSDSGMRISHGFTLWLCLKQKP